MADLTCYIWDTPAIEAKESSGDIVYVNSPRAGGLYSITGSATTGIKNLTRDERARLTTWLCNQRNGGIEYPKIDSYLLDNVKTFPHLTTAQRVERTLLYLNKILRVGATLTVATSNNKQNKDEVTQLLALTESLGNDELFSFFKLLVSMGLLNDEGGSLAFQRFALSANGWLEIDRLQIQPSLSSQAFVAMWFDASTEAAYNEGIGPAITKSGYISIRIDNKEHVNKIDDEIVAEIRRSKFLVADFTCEPGRVRGGVYFEAGFAMGLQIPVIWTCSETSKNDLHFDTRQYNHIMWQTPEDLRTKLTARIGAVIGDGPLKK
jgi:nucleoside 2-deoxyribosyltransferase